jgi:uncharacterized membrane protein YeaQ/YmgE (transglycosylase-associated protein family)
MITWILLGFIIGIVGVFLAPRESSVLGGIILGILGAVLGGFLGTVLFDQTSGFNLQVILVVLFGAVLLVTLQRSILRH